MKTIKNIFALVAFVLLVAACNKNEQLAPQDKNNFPEDGIIRVVTNVLAPQTRVSMTADNLTEFNMRIINETNSDYSYHALMIKSENEWKSNYQYGSGNYYALNLLWQNKIQKVKVAAVSGGFYIKKEAWNEGFNILLSTNQADEALVIGNDILHMKEIEVDPSKNLVNGKIQVAFKHRLSKLNITVKMGTEFNKIEGGTANNLISNISVGNTYTAVLWKIIQDELSDYSNIKKITPWENTTAYKVGSGDTNQAEAKYECILIPQVLAANGSLYIEFTLKGKSYRWQSTEQIILNADTQYNLTLIVGNDVVTVAGFSATPWSEVDPQDIGTL